MADGIEQGAEIVIPAIVTAADYVAQHACDILVRSLLSGAFAALAADGQEQAGLADLAGICASQTIDNVLLRTTARALAVIITAPIWAIDRVHSNGFFSQSEAQDIVVFLIVKACKTKPGLPSRPGDSLLPE